MNSWLDRLDLLYGVSYLFDEVHSFINFILTYSELQQLNLKRFGNNSVCEHVLLKDAPANRIVTSP